MKLNFLRNTYHENTFYVLMELLQEVYFWAYESSLRYVKRAISEWSWELGQMTQS